MQFNPNDYATVDERHRAARKDNPTMVVETIMLNSIDCPASVSYTHLTLPTKA